MKVVTSYKKYKGLMTDFHHVVAQATRRGRVIGQRIFYGIFGFLGIASGCTLLFIATDRTEYSVAALGLIFGIYFAIRCLFYYQYLGFFTGRMMTKEIDEVIYTFDEEKVVIDNALEHCEHPYHVFFGVYESKRIFVLMVTKRIGYIIAKADFTQEELERFRALLCDRFEVPLKQFDF